jgi:hypothetical protein
MPARGKILRTPVFHIVVLMAISARRATSSRRSKARLRASHTNPQNI